jgi:serine/threonine-protein kinase
MNRTDRVLSGRYRLDNHLARGGMADVYVATDEVLGRRVAVKMLHANFAGDAAFIQRFRREAQAAANLTHPNIVSIYDTGQDDNTHFIVMELVAGTTLRDVLKTEKRLMPRRAAEIAAEVAAALAVAARSGLAHRDIKPGNILITKDGSVKVADFGIARAWDDSEELTRTGAVIGTATYFSPEQAQGHAADGRSDIYALGIVLYEMLTGSPPFSGESPVAVAYQHVSEIAAPPSAANPDVDLALDRIVMRALEKSPTNRYQTADDLRQDLLRYLQGAPVAAADPEGATRVMSPPPPTVPPEEAYRQVASPLEPSRTPWSVWIGSVALLVVAIAAFFFVAQSLNTEDVQDTLVELPNLVGLTQERALEELLDLGLRFTIVDRPSDDVAAGEVAETRPIAGTLVDPADRVTLFVSSGPETFTVPRVIGRDVVAARDALIEAGFVFEIVPVADDVVPANEVIDQDPPAGTNHPPGTSITLTVSAGPEEVVLPEYAGFSLEDALNALVNLGVQVQIVKEFHPTIPDDEVIRTEPRALEIITKNDQVTLFVSQGPEPVAVPNLVGRTEGDARNALAALGLRFEISATELVTDESGQAGTVLRQQPAAEVLVAPGSLVSVVIGEAPPPTTTTTTTVP